MVVVVSRLIQYGIGIACTATCSTRDVSPPKGYWEKVKVTEVPGVLYSDTESALKLLRNLDVLRKNRHLEIRIEWIKERVSLGQLSLIFRKGVDNPSDLLTKCLGSAAFGIHRSTLGFQVSEGSLAGLVAVAKRSLVFIEVCCRENSAICQACRDMGIQYIGISKRHGETVSLQ